jgi:hypothetical protein
MAEYTPQAKLEIAVQEALEAGISDDEIRELVETEIENAAPSDPNYRTGGPKPLKPRQQ